MLTNFSLDQCRMGHVTTLVMVSLCTKKTPTLTIFFFFLLEKGTYENTASLWKIPTETNMTQYG